MKSINIKAFLAITMLLGVTLLSGCNRHGDDYEVSAPLTAIAVTPVNPGTPNGLNKQFTAIGTYADGTSSDITNSATWSSEDTAIATINASGLATSNAVGSSIITASSGAFSANTLLTVNDATLISIALTPVDPSIASGLSSQFTATGTYSDGSAIDISAEATWTSADILVATINTSGLASSVSVGSSLITANLGAQSATSILTVTNATLSSMVVTPVDPSLVAGLTLQFVATGTYSDSSLADITDSVIWSSGDILIATINAAGLASGIDTGTVLITATSDLISANTTLMVTAAVLSSIEVTPVDPSITEGGIQQFTAMGNYSDGSTSEITSLVIWSSSDTLVATMNPNNQPDSGLASGIDVGFSLITATLDTISADSTLTVNAAIDNPLAPDMGEVARFVVLASQAITTTSGTAIVDGDLGILDQARSFYSGFTNDVNAGEFVELTNGLSYAGDDTTPPYTVPVPYASMVAFINQSRTDLTIAYDFLAADPNPNAATQVCPIELGNLTLTRGVYKTADNVTIQTGSLTLDAQGDPDSVFIFTIGGNLTSGAPGGDIILINGAQAKNVYWRTAGKTIVGAGTSFSGNVFAFSQVNVLTNASVNGRLFALTELVTLDSNAVTKAN